MEKKRTKIPHPTTRFYGKSLRSKKVFSHLKKHHLNLYLSKKKHLGISGTHGQIWYKYVTKFIKLNFEHLYQTVLRIWIRCFINESFIDEKLKKVKLKTKNFPIFEPITISKIRLITFLII